MKKKNWTRKDHYIIWERGGRKEGGTHWMPLQGMQTKVQKVVQTYWGPCHHQIEQQVLTILSQKRNQIQKPQVNKKFKTLDTKMTLGLHFHLI